jgi:hypothetical protein
MKKTITGQIEQQKQLAQLRQTPPAKSQIRTPFAKPLLIDLLEDVLEIPEPGTPRTTQNIPKPIELIQRIIQKEMVLCATQMNIECEELQAWIDLQFHVPSKTILTLLRTATQYGLDLLREEVMLSPYEDSWHVSISVDGWIKLINQHPAFTGVTFTQSPDVTEGSPIWMECTIYRSDRTIPITVREYLSEVKNTSDAWQKMPRRMLRHRVLQQCARLAIGIALKGDNEKEPLNSCPTTIALPQAISSPTSSCNFMSQSDSLKKILKQKA